jgi:hypothetical protein
MFHMSGGHCLFWRRWKVGKIGVGTKLVAQRRRIWRSSLATSAGCVRSRSSSAWGTSSVDNPHRQVHVLQVWSSAHNAFGLWSWTGFWFADFPLLPPACVTTALADEFGFICGCLQDPKGLISNFLVLGFFLHSLHDTCCVPVLYSPVCTFQQKKLCGEKIKMTRYMSSKPKLHNKYFIRPQFNDNGFASGKLLWRSEKLLISDGAASSSGIVVICLPSLWRSL